MIGLHQDLARFDEQNFTSLGQGNLTAIAINKPSAEIRFKVAQCPA